MPGPSMRAGDLVVKGVRMATMADVARHAGVSPKTVSNVINGFRYVSDDTRERVEAAIAELGYQLNVTARNLRSGRTGMIGLAVPEIAQAYFAELAEEAMSAARDHGLHVLVLPTGFTREGELDALRVASSGGLLDGMLFSPAELGPEDAEALDIGRPLVLLGEQLFVPGADHVTMRNVEAARAATGLLLDRGRRRIAALGAPAAGSGGTARLRFEGYADALRARGLDVDPRLTVELADGWRHANGARSMAAVLDAGAQPDGVVAFNDALAIGAMSELHRRGLRIPEDVAVIGFDDTDDARYTQPSLTSVDAGRREIVRTAIDLLRRRIDGSTSGPELHYATMRIVERGSTPTA